MGANRLSYPTETTEYQYFREYKTDRKKYRYDQLLLFFMPRNIVVSSVFTATWQIHTKYEINVKSKRDALTLPLASSWIARPLISIKLVAHFY